MEQALRYFFSSMEIHFGKFIASFNRDDQGDLLLAAALLVRSINDGHSCLDLNDIAGKVLFENEALKIRISLPPLLQWVASLKNTSCVGCPGEAKPLVLDKKTGFIYIVTGNMKMWWAVIFLGILSNSPSEG